MEKLLISKIETGIRGIKLGTKELNEVEEIVNKSLERLTKSNVGMAEDLGERWRKVVKNYNEKKVVKN